MKTSIIGLDWNTITGMLSIELHAGVLASIIILFLIGMTIFFIKQRNRFPLVDIEIEISSSPKVVFTIKRDDASLYLANRIYVELQTRKVVLPFEEDKDVLIELYESWYLLFGSIREEIKNIPGEHIRNSNSSRVLINLSIDILNKGLRPHLTTYQASFKKWYTNALEEEPSEDLSPQEIQEQFPKYEELIEDMKLVQQTLINYVTALEQFITIPSHS